MIDYKALLLDPIYQTIGVPASVIMPDSDETTYEGLTVIDKTAGVALGDQPVQVESLEPAAAVRAAELSTRGIDPTDLDGAFIEFNGFRWTIKGRHNRPVPSGARDGELLLILSNEQPASESSS